MPNLFGLRLQFWVRAAACEDPLETDLRDAKCGPSPPEAAARCGSIRNRKFIIQDSKFRITNRGAACGVHASSGSNCGPPPGGGSGPPIAARSIPTQALTNTAAARTGARNSAPMQAAAFSKGGIQIRPFRRSYSIEAQTKGPTALQSFSRIGSEM